jgi:hypothetical protein
LDENIRRLIETFEEEVKIDWFYEYFSGLSDLEREEYFAHAIQKFREEWRRSGREYFKADLGTVGKNIYLIFWAPEGRTRPHRHIYPKSTVGSLAKIYVLEGTLTQDLFAIWDEDCEILSRSEHPANGDPIEEDGEIVHRLGNKSLTQWAVSLHEFVPGFRMKVFDFGRNSEWFEDGTQDTLGRPPHNAKQIWRR